MASKGQKFKKHTPKLKMKVLEAYFHSEGGYSSLGKKFGISRNTIRNWLRKTKNDIDPLVDHRPKQSGRKKKINEIDYKERHEILKKYQAFLKARQERK